MLKKVKSPTIVFALIAFLCLCLFWIAIFQDKSNNNIQNPIIAAPFFNFELTNGETINSDNMNGKSLFIYFWASWCNSCIKEMKLIENEWNSYQNEGYIFLGVNVFDNEKDASSFVDKNGITFPISYKNKDSIVVDFGLNGIPEAFFITEDLIIKKKIIGPFDEKELKISLEQNSRN